MLLVDGCRPLLRNWPSFPAAVAGGCNEWNIRVLVASSSPRAVACTSATIAAAVSTLKVKEAARQRLRKPRNGGIQDLGSDFHRHVRCYCSSGCDRNIHSRIGRRGFDKGYNWSLSSSNYSTGIGSHHALSYRRSSNSNVIGGGGSEGGSTSDLTMSSSLCRREGVWWFSACSARRLFVVGASCSVFRAYSSSSSSSATATTATGGGSHYETLGAYVALALKLHPDRNRDDPNAAMRFNEIRAAYDVLSQPFTRSHYDRQCEGTRGVGAMGEAVWEEETEEQRTLRRERYQRYAAEQRNDVPVDDTPGVAPVILCAFLTIAYFSVAYPKAREAEECYGVHDRVTTQDTRGDTLVRAFYNPLSCQWERIPKGLEAPLPSALHTMYAIRHPSLHLEKSHMPKQLAVSQMPQSQTEPSRLARDPITGEHVWTDELLKHSTGSCSSSSSRNGGNNSNSSGGSPNEALASTAIQGQPKGAAALCS
ncbi:DnaJ domain-containing protein, putative [Eimeria tenella]|uniref:DnaJ domain-containing protein, putative n=2 Tax=Eimeria tenella TaxID=5802 RepID=U6KZQ1_EIMTE|nr:DnaJ domain-containing protein, putative [Eimeria tenella]CDJ41824.1 DnaJ domain-containing protein, putative [Eimeria tenella]|eukprot:XP_013232574.1 DnaJ domain-containing protein, putative [Eimeria tenella]